jgi:hypothetical protein
MRAATEATIVESQSLMREADVLLYSPPKGWLRTAALKKRVNVGQPLQPVRDKIIAGGHRVICRPFRTFSAGSAKHDAAAPA